MAGSKGSTRPLARRSTARAYPFTSIVGQEEMRLALLLNVVEPSIGGVLISGHRGTGKSTAVRALAELLPPLTRSAHCSFNCDPDRPDDLCDVCLEALNSTGKLRRERVQVPVVDLPLNATEDRVCGAINLGRAIREGVSAFDPGLLARAHRGFLYIDEVNLLEDHLVDLLLDVSASGRNRVEREGVSAGHAARFVLVGSSNPEEGELRPQLLDRFGLCAEVRTPENATERAEVVTRREAFDRDREAFCDVAEAEQANLRRKLSRARREAAKVEVPRALVQSIAELCARLGVDGHRGELTITRASRALAAFEGRKVATEQDARLVAGLALRHRLRRDPFEPTGGGGQIEKMADEVLGDDRSNAKGETDARASVSKSESAKKSEECSNSEAQTAINDLIDDSGRDSGANKRHATPEGAGGTNTKTMPAPMLDHQINLHEPAEARAGRAPQRTKLVRRGRTPATTLSVNRGRFGGQTVAHQATSAIALDASLRAAVERLTRTIPDEQLAKRDSFAALKPRLEGWPQARRNSFVEIEDLRFKLFTRKAGALYIFAVDTSGSMAVNRISQAKGTLARLLRRSYVERDRVALITFRGSRGEVLLRPARSPALARRLLDALPVGGATPLASGLNCAQEIAQSARREGAQRITLLIFTDGRANVPLAKVGDEDRASLRQRLWNEVERVGEYLQRAGVESVVIDTRARFAGDAEGKRLALSLGGSYTRLSWSEQSA